MKVTHICTSFSGGAGICASRILQATAKRGIEAKAIVAEGFANDTTEVIKPRVTWSDRWAIQKLQSLLAIAGMGPKALQLVKRIEREQRKTRELCCFTSPVTGYTNLPHHPWIEDADVIHLHWVGGFLDYESFFCTVKKPIVWTIHDENPGLGGFHYSSWKQHAPKSFQHLDDALMKRKSKAYSMVKDMTLVAISNQMDDYFKMSPLLQRFPRTIIHNGIDGQQFRPIARELAKDILGIPQENTVFLFAAQNSHEERKGLKELLSALTSLNIPRTTLICLGQYQEVPKAPFEVRCEGFIPNSRLQSLYYSAANFFMMPSFQEAFAQAPMEAMACGTPVIAFPCSGTDSLINEGNGIVCHDFTVDSLVESIQAAREIPFDSMAIRRDVLERFSYDKIAEQYLDLYHQIQQGNH